MNFTDTSSLLQALNDGFGQPRVVVVGDLMLDHYLIGNVERVSPEAPIPVVHLQREKWVLGGAGNVAANLRGLGAQVTLCGVVGEDLEARRIAELLSEQHIQAELLTVNEVPSIVKTRILGENHHIVRVDREAPLNPGAWQEAFVEQVLAALNGADAMLLSDYGKGVLSPEVCHRLIEACRERRCPVMVDPKGRDFGKYRGASVVTPNVKELLTVTGRQAADEISLIDQAREVLNVNGIGAVLLTRGAEGMSFITADTHVYQRATAQTVFDVSGAGDTVVAAATLMLIGGFAWSDILGLANLAASLVISKPGTVAIHRQDLLQHFTAHTASLLSHERKILSAQAAASSLDQARREGRRVVFTNGCFDLLHPGHLKLLEQARHHGDVLVVGINSDTSVQRLKGPLRPMNNEQDRAALLSGLEAVDHVVIFEEDTPLALIEQLQPDVLIKGGDYRLGDIVGSHEVVHRGGAVKTIPMKEGYSSTRLINRIAERMHGI